MTVDGIVKQYVCIASDGIAASTHRGDHIGPRRDAYPVGATLCGRPYGMNVRYAFADLRRSSRKRYCRGVGARPLRFALGRPVSPAEHCVHRPRNIACIARGTLRAEHSAHHHYVRARQGLAPTGLTFDPPLPPLFNHHRTATINADDLTGHPGAVG